MQAGFPLDDLSFAGFIGAQGTQPAYTENICQEAMGNVPLRMQQYLPPDLSRKQQKSRFTSSRLLRRASMHLPAKRASSSL